MSGNYSLNCTPCVCELYYSCVALVAAICVMITSYSLVTDHTTAWYIVTDHTTAGYIVTVGTIQAATSCVV